MDSTYSDVSSLWDLTQPSNFAHVPEDDFMAMFQKQFPLSAPPTGPTQNIQPFAAGGFPDGVNPQNISRFPPPSLTPPSEDSSSPSPPNSGSNHEPNHEDAGGGGGGGNSSNSSAPQTGGTESALKRKANGVDIPEDGPSQKSQHTCGFISHTSGICMLTFPPQYQTTRREPLQAVPDQEESLLEIPL